MISVIIPVHNAESFLERCINSILTNTYKDLEVILIENGSTDSSRDLCYRLEKENSNVKVIVSEIKGVSNARNLGLEAATGDYIAFVDADDYVSPYYFETLQRISDKNDADIVVCDYSKGTESSFTFARPNNTEKLIDKDYYFRNHYVKETLQFTAPWSKLFKKRIVDSVRFDTELSMCEDRTFVTQCVCRAEKIYYVQEKMYYYFLGNDNSICKKTDQDLRMDMVYSLKKDLAFIQREYPQKQLWLDLIYVSMLLTSDFRLKKVKKEGRKDLTEVLKPLNKEALIAVKHSVTLGRLKFRILFEHYFPNTLQFLYKIAQKLRLR